MVLPRFRFSSRCNINLSARGGTLALLAGLATGCSDGRDTVCIGAPGAPECALVPGALPAPSEPSPTEPEPGSPSEPAASEPETSPAFVLGTRIWDDTTTTSYFHVVPSLAEGTTVSNARALEVPGAAKLFSAFDLGWFAIGSGESPEITRYVLDAAGNLVEDARISLQPYGVGSLWDTLYFISPTKAYYPDRDGGQLIVWNPSAMQVVGSVPLPETLRDGYLANYSYSPILRGSELLISVGWFDWDVNDTVLGETGLLVFDTLTDSVVRFDLDTRCGGVTHPVESASGDTFLISSALAGAAHRLGRLALEPCALRIPHDADRIDPDYFVSLGDVAGGQTAGEPVPAAGGVFLRVFDDALAAADEPMATWELTGRAAWRWYRWDLGSAPASMVSELPPSTADVLWFELDGHVYGTETTEDYSATTLIDISAPSAPRRGLTVPGFLHGVARVR